MEPFEQLLHEELLHYLKSLGIIHSDIDVCAEMDDLWEKIARPYVPDAIRQWDTHQSPATTMGSMMYIGMAVAKLWQQGEQERCKMDNLYQRLYNRGLHRDRQGRQQRGAAADRGTGPGYGKTGQRLCRSHVCHVERPGFQTLYTQWLQRVSAVYPTDVHLWSSNRKGERFLGNINEEWDAERPTLLLKPTF